jgi:hypothetical protein
MALSRLMGVTKHVMGSPTLVKKPMKGATLITSQRKKSSVILCFEFNLGGSVQL